MGVGDAHPKHAASFPAASTSLRRDTRKVGLSGWQGKEGSWGRQCCCGQGAPLGVLGPAGRGCSVEPSDETRPAVTGTPGAPELAGSFTALQIPESPACLAAGRGMMRGDISSSPSLVYLSLSLMTKLCEPIILESIQSPGAAGCSPFCQGPPSAPL